jgi:hypothetical protein
VVPRRSEVAEPPFRVGFETAAGKHHGLRVQGDEAIRPACDDAVHAPALRLRQPLRASVVADLDTRFLRGLEPGLRQPDTLVVGAYHRAARPFELVADLDAHYRDRELETMLARVLQPAHGVVGIFYEYGCQLGIAAPLGDAQQVLTEHFGGIGLDAFMKAGIVLFGGGDEAVQLPNLVVDEAEHRAAEVRIPAAFLLRRFFQHQHALRAVFLRRYRGGKSGIAAADHYHVIVHGSIP